MCKKKKENLLPHVQKMKVSGGGTRIKHVSYELRTNIIFIIHYI